MHSNYFMYTIPSNGNSAQITTVPTLNHLNMKQPLTSISQQNAVIPNNVATIIRAAGNGHQTIQIANNPPPPPSIQNTQQNVQFAPSSTQNTCHICGQSFSKAGLKRHMKMHKTTTNTNGTTHTDNSPYKCNACKVDYLNATSFEHHIKTEHGQPQAMKCVDCGCFRQIELTSGSPFRCEGCSQRKCEPFEDTGVLNFRVTSTANANSSSQIHVNYVKTPKLDLDTLVQTMRSGEANGRRSRKLHQCPDCDKCYRHQSTLAMHKKVHTGEYKYKCEYCQKEFYLAEYYNRHMRVHTKEKPYQCNVCQKAFSQSNTLIQHKRIHTGLLIS